MKPRWTMRKKPQEIEAHLSDLFEMFTKAIVDEGKYLNVDTIREIRKSGSCPVMHFEIGAEHVDVVTQSREDFAGSLIGGAASEFRERLFRNDLDPETVFVAFERDKHAGIVMGEILISLPPELTGQNQGAP
jgi:hypothetical protein